MRGKFLGLFSCISPRRTAGPLLVLRAALLALLTFWGRVNEASADEGAGLDTQSEAPQKRKSFSARLGIGVAAQVAIPHEAGPMLYGGATLFGISWRLSNEMRVGALYLSEMAIAAGGFADTHSPLLVVEFPIAKERCARLLCSSALELGTGWSFQYSSSFPEASDSFSGAISGPAVLLGGNTDWAMGRRANRRLVVGSHILAIPYYTDGSGFSFTSRVIVGVRL